MERDEEHNMYEILACVLGDPSLEPLIPSKRHSCQSKKTPLKPYSWPSRFSLKSPSMPKSLQQQLATNCLQPFDPYFLSRLLSIPSLMASASCDVAGNRKSTTQVKVYDFHKASRWLSAALPSDLSTHAWPPSSYFDIHDWWESISVVDAQFTSGPDPHSGI